MNEDIQNATYTLSIPEKSECKCYMFGSRPDGNGLVYHPNKDNEPNWFGERCSF